MRPVQPHQFADCLAVPRRTWGGLMKYHPGYSASVWDDYKYMWLVNYWAHLIPGNDWWARNLRPFVRPDEK